MELSREWTRRTGHEGAVVPCYEVRPKVVKGPLPTVLLVQEAFGVDEHIQDVGDRLAIAGYFVVAPDLYARGGQRPPTLSPERMEMFKNFMELLPPGGWAKAELREETIAKLPADQQGPLKESLGVFFGGLPRDKYPLDLAAISTQLAKDAKVGAVGFCMGGGLVATLAVTDAHLSCAVAYYGMLPAPEKAADLRCPMLANVAEGSKDPAIFEAANKFAEAANKAGKSFELHEYKGAMHAFNNDSRGAYNVNASRLAWARTLAFFAKHLAP